MSLLDELHALPLEEAVKVYDRVWDDGYGAIAELAKADRFFLLTYVLRRLDAVHPWLYARCREVERSPDGHLDLWAREHYKSTIITYAGVIQEILRDPEITVGIFSYKVGKAAEFLGQIRRELSENQVLKSCFPDVLWSDPVKECARKRLPWSETAITVKRKSNPKEPTIQACGLVDGMPTGSHFRLRVYDDVVTKDNVTTPEMIHRTTEAWELSGFLGTMDGRVWYIGTRYHFNDTYKTIIERGAAEPRLYPATSNGLTSGDPVLLTNERLADLRRDMGPYTFACQMLQNPVADEAQGFKREWIEYFDSPESRGMNRYILVDPANEKKKTSDYTAMFVVGLGADNNYYVLDIVRDRLNLSERWQKLLRLHQKWKPLAVGYEKYGIQADVQYFREKMAEMNYRFHITELGGQTKKEDRIRRLIPVFENRRVYLPESLWYVDYEGRKRDLVREFVEQEYMGFPVAVHDDMLDCLARIRDPEFHTSWPKGTAEVSEGVDPYALPKRSRGTWMSA